MTFLNHYVLRLVGLIAAVATISEPISVRAESAQPLRLVTRCDAGSPIDLMTRIIAQGLANDLARPVIVENLGRSADEARAAVNDANTILFQIADCDDKNEALQTTVAGK
jgi:tripartite-type tricarboxylate transporter receptor subunit TctC